MPTIKYQGYILYQPTFSNSVPISNQNYNIPITVLQSLLNWKDSTNVPPGSIQRMNLSHLLTNKNIYNTVVYFNIDFYGVTNECQPNSFGYNIQLKTSLLINQQNYANTNINQRSNVCIWNYTGSSAIKIPSNPQSPTDLTTDLTTTHFPNILNLTFNSGTVFVNVLNIYIQVELSIDCSSDNLNQNICTAYCDSNLTQCRKVYLDYCFGSDNQISTNPNCQNYFSDYIESAGPRQEIDTALNNYCKKYTSFYDLEKNAKDINICACHLPDEFYTKFQNELYQALPQLKGVFGLNKYCLYPYCASSPFKNVTIGKQCQVANCFSMVGFNPSGNIDTKKVIINQNSKCAGGADSSKKVIFIIISVLFLLIIYLIIIYNLKKK